MKKKFIGANDGPFMTKALRKAITNRTLLRNKYDKDRNDENRQRNLCLNLLREAKHMTIENSGRLQSSFSLAQLKPLLV